MGYHWAAFKRMTYLYEKEIRYVLIEKYAGLRREFILRHVDVNQTVSNDVIWRVAREGLEYFDEEMKQLIIRRSASYWLHIYRRLGVMLSPEHEGDTSEVTLGLVRQIVELAIQKHGLISAEREFGMSDKLSPNIVLGGWMTKGMKHIHQDPVLIKEFIRTYHAMLRDKPTPVIRSFGKKDLIDIYAIEGAAYQYWRLTALLRSIGKGAKVSINEQGDWQFLPDESLSKLIESVDARNKEKSSFSSLSGIWLDEGSTTKSTGNTENLEDYDYVFLPFYNLARTEFPSGVDFFGMNFGGGTVTNFFATVFKVGTFFTHHEFMRDSFEKKNGFDFETLICALVGFSSFTIFPKKVEQIENKDERNAVLQSSIKQTLMRGYHVFSGNIDDLSNMLHHRMESIFSKEFDREIIDTVVSAITLNEDKQSQISPWSNGPRSLIIPSEKFMLLDFVGLPAYLGSLFAFMKDPYGAHGTIFEKLFRDGLERRNHKVVSGDLINSHGTKRELDAGVIVGDKMYLFECVSIERRLDYEIGNPRTIAERQAKLEEKITQAQTLARFVHLYPVGRNYDFSEVSDVEWFVVSPFVEWIWEIDASLWFNDLIPRVIAPNEAFELLQTP